MSTNNKPSLNLSRPEDKSLESYRAWILALGEAIGCPADDSSDEEWEQDWKEFWAE